MCHIKSGGEGRGVLSQGFLSPTSAVQPMPPILFPDPKPGQGGGGCGGVGPFTEPMVLFPREGAGVTYGHF